MKNFRKVLALVLVVATLFSFTAMAGAVSYKDAAKVDDNYEMAVDVLTAVGILNGYEVAKDEYEFHPTDKITREEMAKMIAVMANAGDDVSKLYASACTFADVAKDRWSASYVAYCAKTGIVAGRSATTFDPKANVTGLETAKMLLVVLGFDAEKQGYIGSDWKVNVLRDAKAMGMLDGFKADYNIDVAITREEAAHMMLNALLTNVVVGHLSENSTVVVTNKLLGAWSNKNGLKWTLVDAKGEAVLYGNVIISNTTLWEALYGGKLSYESTGVRDCYGRPAAKWIWTNDKGKKTEVGTYAATPIWTSHDTTEKEVMSKINAYVNDQAANGNILYFKDGVRATLQASDLGKGVLVELYKTKDADGDVEFTIVAINTYVGTITELNTVSNKVKIADNNSNNTYLAENTNGYGLKDEGTTVLYWVCGTKAVTDNTKDVHKVETADVKTMTVHGVWETIGELCDTAENKFEAAKGLTFTDNLVGKKVNYVLDKFGYIKAIDVVGKEINYSILVTESARKTPNYESHYGQSSNTYEASFVEFGTNPAESALTKTDKAMYDNADWQWGYEDIGHYCNRLVGYTVNGNGDRCFVSDADAKIRYAGPAEASKDVILQKGTFEVENLNANVAVTNNTKIVLRVYNYMKGVFEYKYFEGKNAIDNDYIVSHMMYTVTNSNYTDPTLWLDLVYAEAKYAATSAMAFVTGFYTDETYVTEGGVKLNCYLYKAYVNGEEALVAFENKQDGKEFDRIWTADYQLIVAASHNQLPIYMAVTSAEASKGYNFYAENGTLTYTDTEGKQKFLDLKDDATIVVIATKEGTTSAILKKADELATYLTAHSWKQRYGWFNTSGGAVDTLYVYVSDVDPATT